MKKAYSNTATISTQTPCRNIMEDLFATYITLAASECTVHILRSNTFNEIVVACTIAELALRYLETLQSRRQQVRKYLDGLPSNKHPVLRDMLPQYLLT